ncbi:unnamed protein product [Closterium sp. NIES-64]|nr:unnamed protein product [Closterium sp. NIES-64]
MAALRGNKGEPALDVRWSAPISENEMRYVEDYVKARYPAIFTECIVGLGFPMPCVLEEPDGGGYRGGNGGGYGGGLSPMAELLAMDDEEGDAEGEGGYGGMGGPGAVFGRSNSTDSMLESRADILVESQDVLDLPTSDILVESRDVLDLSMSVSVTELHARRRILQQCGVESEEYHIVFTPSVQEAMVLVAEAYPFHRHNVFLTALDQTDDSISMFATHKVGFSGRCLLSCVRAAWRGRIERRGGLERRGRCMESEEYHIVFTPSVQEAMVLVAEAYPFHRHIVFLTALDQTDDSISIEERERREECMESEERERWEECMESEERERREECMESEEREREGGVHGERGEGEEGGVHGERGEGEEGVVHGERGEGEEGGSAWRARRGRGGRRAWRARSATCLHALISLPPPFPLCRTLSLSSSSIPSLQDSKDSKDSKVIQAPLSWLDLQKPGSQLSTNFRRKSKANPKGLFAYPMCANGQTFSLHWVSEAQRTCWHVLLDVTAIELDSGVFNLTSHKPDYVLCCSPRIVGYPYRLACLLVKRGSQNTDL